MSGNREWMYQRVKDNMISTTFLDGLESFIKFARDRPEFMNRDKIKCPCNKCKNKAYHTEYTVRLHLAQSGFVPNYYQWKFQGEREAPQINYDQTFEGGPGSATYFEMLRDVGASQFRMNENEDEPPNPAAQQFYDMLHAADKELWPGCKKHSQLSVVARLMNLKSENNITEKCYDQIATLLKEAVPENNLVTEDFYSTKKLLRGMGLPVEKIDSCPNHCMIYWGANSVLSQCKCCGHPRYKNQGSASSSRPRKQVAFKKMYYFPLTPRLQRLYASTATAESMRWHASSVDDGVMRHPADSPAWKHLNDRFPHFSSEIRNIRLGLSTDGFQPFGQSGQQYSLWPVILTPYNLPPWMCMKEQYMFLTVLVPGPRNPKMQIDVYLQPLISELRCLWEEGVPTYDIYARQNFQMYAALLWTISDFPAYAMLSGWSTAGRLACPHCMEHTEAFTLPCSGKQSWFDTHRKFLPDDHPFRRNIKAFSKNKRVVTPIPEVRTGEELLNEIEMLGLKKVTDIYVEESSNRPSKRSTQSNTGWKKKSIFWDLPYWSSLLIRHNLDVMHIEKNVFDNIFNTVMSVPGKTKDTTKSREELNKICIRPELQRDERTGKYPKAIYTLDKAQRSVLCSWLKTLQFPDGYCSNLAYCVNMEKLKMFGMKSHDCHVLMQRIIPIAFRELLPLNVWKAITDLSMFFKELTSGNIKVEDVCRLHENIPVILCKLERIFPPSFFDSMEHLPIHLADEARMGGPVQYRWMYPFERYLGKLKKNVRNKARVEGSICNAYLVEEASSFCSYYFEDHVGTRHKNLPRNYEGDGVDEHFDDPDNLSIFQLPGRSFGKSSKRYLNEKEYNAARQYVLLNCSEVTDVYLSLFVEQLKATCPSLTDVEIDSRMDKEFTSWFEAYVMDPMNNVRNKFIISLAKGPLRKVMSYHGYYVNGYKFHTTDHETRRSTMNSGVCIKGSNYSTNDCDFYGRLLEVVILEYTGLPLKRTALFRCEWFDPSQGGTLVQRDFKLVSINHKRRYNKYEPFVLAAQAVQVYYCPYPSLNQSKKDWWEACKIKARATIEVPSKTIAPPPFQEDDFEYSRDQGMDDDDPIPCHVDGGFIDLAEREVSEEEVIFSDAEDDNNFSDNDNDNDNDNDDDVSDSNDDD